MFYYTAAINCDKNHVKFNLCAYVDKTKMHKIWN